MKNIIFEINGGIGKSVIGTTIVKELKFQYPEYNIVVLTEYPSVFYGNPHVYRACNTASSYFYDNYIRNHEVVFKCMEPYKTDAFLNQTDHIARIWGDVNGLKDINRLPELFLSALEIRRMRNSVSSDKPILIFQPFGGFSKDIKYSWNRDIPPQQAQEIVNKLQDKYHIIQLARPDQIILQGVTQFYSDNLRESLALIRISDARIGIDSFMQHCAAAFQLPTKVCWITNNPNVFGYYMHDNILPIAEKSEINFSDALLMENDFTGSRIYNFPYATTDIFDVDQIISGL